MKRMAESVATLLVAAIFAAILVGVARRYLFGVPLVWIDELTTVLFIWSIFWTAAFVLANREHVAFDLVYGMLPERGRRAVGVVAALLVGIALLAAAPKIGGYLQFLWRERTPALQWRLDWVFACFGFFIVAAGLRFVIQAGRLMTRRWREHL